MRISSQLLRSRAARPLHGVEYLDLSRLGLVSVDRLELCPKIQTLNLRDNRIDAVPNFDCCSQLWTIDLANNRLRSLEALCRFTAFGSLILSNNELDWKELQKIRHLHILVLTLHGNPMLEIDAYYRMHVIDSLPLVWMLDGRIITSAERAQVRQFFKDSALCDRPVRHKLPKNHFIPTSLKNISVTGVHGHRTDHMMRRFPQKTTQNIDLDKRRLQYLAYNLQQDVNLELKHKTRGKFKSFQLIENLIACRKEDQERCNMVLLLLVASLEFAIPSTIIQQTLDVARLRKIEKIETMDLFMFTRETRCRVVSLLLSAVKIERDQNIDGGLYNRLYLSLYDLVSDLSRLANGDDISRYQAVRKKFDSRKSGYRSLLASEIVQLLCIVPVFFDFIGRDPGVMDLVSVATKDPEIGDQIKALSWKIQSEGGGRNRVYQEVAQFLLHIAKEANANSLGNTGKAAKITETWNNDYLAFRLEPSYIITSKRLVKVPPERPHSSAATVPAGNLGDSASRAARSPRASTALGVRTRDSVRTRATTAKRRPALNDRVEIGHQACGRLVALPETHVGLVQLDSVAAPRFQQADYSHTHDSVDGQFHYVNFKLMEWEGNKCVWRQATTTKGSQGSREDGHRRSVSSDPEGATQFLSEALQQSLQLRVELPVTTCNEKSSSPPDVKYEGRTLITNHVRSIVRECLEEAEVQWPENEDFPEEMTEQAWVEPERVETPGVLSEVTANVDSESFEAPCELDDESEEPSEVVEPYFDNEDTGQQTLQPPSIQSTLYPTNQTRLHHNEDRSQEDRMHIIDDIEEGEDDLDKSHEEMVSLTEHARLDAWRTPEAMKRGSSSGVPSRVGSASRANQERSTTPPPQRPSSPTHAGPVPMKRADQWLAGGRDVSSMNIKRVSISLPGWMEGLHESRRPKSSPVVRNTRRPMSSVSGSRMSRPTTSSTVRPSGGAASVFISGRPPPSYARIQSARMVVRRR